MLCAMFAFPKSGFRANTCFYAWFVIGQVYLVAYSNAYVLDQKIAGYSWYNYLIQGWFVERRMARQYNYFREPLYPGILGELGEHFDSYANAALLISSLSLSLSSLFIGLATWKLLPKNGAFWGGVASVLLYGTPAMLESSRWGNHYSLLMMGSAIAFWGFSTASRTSIPAALSVALLCSIDQRAILWIIPVVLLHFFSGDKLWKKIAQSLFSVFLIVLIPRMFRVYFSEDSKHRLSLEQVLEFQRDVVQRWSLGDDRQLTMMCRELNQSDFLQLSFLPTDCAQAILSHNWWKQLPQFMPFSMNLYAVLTLILLLLSFFSSGQARRGIYALFAFLQVYFWARIMPLPIRYLPSIAIVLIPIFPLCLGVIEEKMNSFRWGFRLMVALCCFFYFYPDQDENRQRSTFRQQEQTEYWTFWQQFQKQYTEGDRFLDCSEMGLNSLILPKKYVRQPFHQTRRQKECSDWIVEGSGTWIFLSPNSAEIQVARESSNWRESIRYKERIIAFENISPPKSEK